MKKMQMKTEAQRSSAKPNAAKNILTVGQTEMIACQANRISGRQQNPFRARASKPVGNREEVLPVAS